MHGSPRLRRWRHVLPILATMLLVGHAAILHQISSRPWAGGIVALGAMVLLVLKHRGLLGPLYAMVRRRVERVAKDDS
jgi:hypothetical protein